MTQSQILNLEHLKIAEVKPNMFVHIHAEDGFIITSWKEGDDIRDYSGSVCMYMPIADNYSDDYRMITITEHDELLLRQREIFENENEKQITE